MHLRRTGSQPRPPRAPRGVRARLLEEEPRFELQVADPPCGEIRGGGGCLTRVLHRAAQVTHYYFGQSRRC